MFRKDIASGVVGPEEMLQGRRVAALPRAPGMSMGLYGATIGPTMAMRTIIEKTASPPAPFGGEGTGATPVATG